MLMKYGIKGRRCKVFEDPSISLSVLISLSFICLPIKPGGMALRAAVGASSMLSFVVVLVKQMGPGAQREKEEKKEKKEERRKLSLPYL